MNRRIVSLGVVSLLIVGLAAASVYFHAAPVKTDKFRLAVSIYPLAYLAGEIGGDHVSVTTVTPSGTEPHEYEPTASDLSAVRDADLVLLNGNGMDPWSDRLIPDVQARGGTVVVMSEVVSDLTAGSKDPHYWLDPVLMQAEALQVRDSLVQIDPQHAPDYKKRALRLISILQDMDSRFRKGLSSCKLHEAVTSHDAFSYLGTRYGVTMMPIARFSPEDEPSAQQIAQLSGLVRAKGIHVILTETLVSPKLAETIASEADATTMTLDPIENAPSNGMDYAGQMYANLQTLMTALQCQ